jgi:hypothetical protein
MPRVVPSRVVHFITSNPVPEHPPGIVLMNKAQPGVLSGLLVLLDQIPDELLTLDDETYASLIIAKERIKGMLETWNSNRNANQSLFGFQLSTSQNPLEQIRAALAQCPHEFPAPGTSELSFVTNEDFRTNLRIDFGVIKRALSDGEWKAATVLAGSAAEALLLWALKQRPPAEITSAIAAARAGGGLIANPDSNLDRWNRHEYIEVAAALGVIKPNTAKQTRLAKDFRNFIHPGVAQRLGEKCDRATAFSAVAGMEHIVRDLTP